MSFHLDRPKEPAPRGICLCGHDAHHHGLGGSGTVTTGPGTGCVRLGCTCRKFAPGGNNSGDASVFEIQQRLGGNMGEMATDEEMEEYIR